MPDISSSLWSGWKNRRQGHERERVHVASAGTARVFPLVLGRRGDPDRARGDRGGGCVVVCPPTGGSDHPSPDRRNPSTRRNHFPPHSASPHPPRPHHPTHPT